MDRVWDWAWDRHGKRYSWAVFWVTAGMTLPIFVMAAWIVVGFEGSGGFLIGDPRPRSSGPSQRMTLPIGPTADRQGG
jgi:hypothetical protein